MAITAFQWADGAQSHSSWKCTAEADAPAFSLLNGPNFLVPVVHRVVSAKLETGKFEGFVLSRKLSYRSARRAQDSPCTDT